MFKSMIIAFTLASSVAASSAIAETTVAVEQFSMITVQSIKPTLTARNVFVIRGTHAKSGTWSVETSYAINKDTKVVQITLVARAPKGATVGKDPAPLSATVDVKELAGTKLAGAQGKYDIVVVDRDGRELARTVFDKK